MTISVVNASADQTLDQTTNTLVNSMTITPGAGDYLAVFTGYFENGATAKTYEFSVFVGGSIVQHTERRIDIEGSIAAASVFTVVTVAAQVTPTAGQAVEVRYRRTTGTTASTMKRRTLTLFPKASADFQQDNSTADQTISSGTYTLLTGADLTPGAGTYLLLFSASATNSSTGATTNNIYYSVFVNGVQVAHTERILNAEASISANLGAMTGLIACKVTPTAGQVVDVRAKRDGTTNWVVHERTLTLMKVADADIKEATQTADEADTGTTDELLVGMTITDPGVADWLAIFSTSQGYGTISVNQSATFSLYNAGVADLNTLRVQSQESSIDNGNYYGFTHGKLTVAGGTDDVTLRWKGSSATSRTAHERTLVMVKEAGGQTIAVGQVTETDLAQALAWAPKARLIGQVSETDIAQALSARKTLGVAQVSEADLAQSITAPRIIAVGQTAETDLAQALAWAPKARLVAQATETDVAQLLTTRKTTAIAQALETDNAQALSSRKSVTVAQALETDLSQAIGRAKAKAITQAAEIDLAQAMTSAKAKAIGQAQETDLAQPVTAGGVHVVAVNQVAETDTAQPIAWAPKARLVAQAGEADVAQAVSSAKTKGIGLVLEIDTAQSVTRVKTRTIGQAAESDVAQLVAHLKSRTVGQALETDLAQLVAHLKTRAVGQALETDFAQSITPFLGALDLIFNIVERIALFQLQLSETARMALLRDHEEHFAGERDHEGRFAGTRDEDGRFTVTRDEEARF